MHSIVNNMATRGGAMGVSSFPSSPSCFRRNARITSFAPSLLMDSNSVTSRRRIIIACSTVQQESSTSAVAAGDTKEEVKAVETKTPLKPKPAAKAPAKPLPQLMEEDVIPSLKQTLESEEDISQLELSFQDNRLEGSFLKNGKPYTFWAFFPNGVLNGPKGFSLSSYGSEASTVEPFLVDEKKITDKLVVFWVEKRLAAQGILPVAKHL